jgi:hypothetical protein
MADRQNSPHENHLTDPGYFSAAVTPSDSADLAKEARGLYIGGAGDLKVTTAGGSTVSFEALPAVFILPVRVRRVFATGQPSTIASKIVAIW